MRVLHIINSLAFGGAEKLIVDSLPTFKEKIGTVDLLVLNKKSKDKQFPIDKNIRVFYLNASSLYSPLLIFKIIPYLKNYDILHLHLFPTLYWGVLAKLFSFNKKIKLIYTEHSTKNKRRDKLIFKMIDRFIYKNLDFIGCISKATEDNLKHHLNNENLNIKVINNGINLDNFFNLKTDINYNFFEETSFVIMQVSSFREQKDQKTLIKAMTLLPSEIKLILVGEGHLRKENEILVDDLNLRERVKFLGVRQDIPELYHYSNICVLSSHYEGFGLAILEGMASRKPSIASDIEGIREVVKGYGLVFEKGNKEELATYIESLYKNSEYYNQIAKKCYERSKEFDIKKMIANYISVYKKVLINKL